MAMAPLFASMDTDKPLSAMPPVTSTVSTHTLLSAVATDDVVVNPALLETRLKSLAVTPVTALSNVAVNLIVLDDTTVPLTPAADENVGVGGSYVRLSGATAACGSGLIAPEPAAKSKVIAMGSRGFVSTLTVSTHSVGPPVTAYVTPGTLGNAVPSLKSATVTPVTGESKVAVTAIVESDVVPGPDDDVRVAWGGESATTAQAVAGQFNRCLPG